MNVYLTTLGCRLNEAELQRWSRGFRDAGHRVVAQPDAAEVVVLNSCAVTGEAARSSRRAARKLHRQAPEAKLVVTGCWATLDADGAEAIDGVDLVVDNQDKDGLVAKVLALDPGMPVMATEPDATVFAEATGRTRAFVKVQDGCRNRCTFCIVTVARGEERSRTVDEVVDEVNALVHSGYREVVLTGVHLGGYGADVGSSLSELVQAVLARTAVPRIRLGSLEPWDLPDGFWQLFADPRLCPHLHLPLQSGCDAILKRMARRCYTDEFAGLVASAKRVGINVTTDLIVGFPGEGEAEFDASAAFVRRMGFGHVHVFPYSPREGTKAARMRDHVAKAEKKRRVRVINGIAATSKQQVLKAAVGRRAPVLWEGRGQPVEGGRRYFGYTPDYLRVCVDSGEDLGNRIVSADIVGLVDGVLQARGQ